MASLPNAGPLRQIALRGAVLCCAIGALLQQLLLLLVSLLGVANHLQAGMCLRCVLPQLPKKPTYNSCFAAGGLVAAAADNFIQQTVT